MAKILLDQPCTLAGNLNMAVSLRAYNEMEENGLDPLAFFQQLSQREMLIFVPQRKGRHRLYTHSGSFTLFFEEDGTVLLASFRKNRLQDNNDCLRLGIPISCEGFLIRITLSLLKESCAYYKGEDIWENYIDEDYARKNLLSPETTAALRNLLEEPNAEPDRQSGTAGHARHEIPPEMAEYLDLAETYAAIDDDLERAAAQQNEPLLFYEPQAALGFDRQDRVAYTVRVDDFDDTEYGANKKVQIELANGAVLGATILSAEKTDRGGLLTLLFEDQVSYSTLPATGALRPTYSDVQHEVRTKVLASLRRGNSPAVFLEQVLGRAQTAGFDDKDLRGLDAALKKQKYPPNASQVEAIHRGINTKDILLVMGPPGTGKTTVILEWVKYFIKVEGKRVLVSSQNNKAVDNVLERLTEEKGISAIRAGNEAKVQANMYPYLLENRMKQLQSDMEARNAANLRTLADLAQQCAAFRAELNGLKKLVNERAALRGQLNSRAAQLLGQLPAQMQQLQKERDSLLTEMEAVKKHLRLLAAYLSVPETNPIYTLRHLPGRRGVQQQAEQALARYTKLYAAYTANREKRQANFEQRACLLTDGDLLETAWKLAQCEPQIKAAQDRLTPPRTRAIFPDIVWQMPEKKLTPDVLDKLTAAVKACEQRLALLRPAVEEWGGHVRAQSNYALSDLLMESVDLVGGTCIGINSQRKFAGVDFDVTIIDEAGQIQIHNALVPMSRSPKVIMLGDHKQIPPIASPEQIAMSEERGVDPTLWGTSLFERLYEQLPETNKIMLDTQYRMPAQLGDLLSEWFYGGKYYSFAGKKNMKSISPRLFASPFVVVDTSADAKRHEYKPEMGAGNHLEAQIVAQIVRRLTDPAGPDALTADMFGIISPYGEQVENIRRAIRRSVPRLTQEQIHEMVASLDSFQGQERKVILYSCTRSNTRPPEQARIGFMKELRRLNVALSRPKEQLVFIGDMQFLSGCKNGSGAGSEREFSAFIRLMMKHAAKDGEILSAAGLARRLGAYYG